MLILNFKNYAEITGANLESTLNDIKKAITLKPEISKLVYVALSPMDLHLAKKSYPEINVISQHVDSKGLGSTTGWISAANLQTIGINISVLNHSEHRLVDQSQLNSEITAIKSANVDVVVCCENLIEADKLLQAKPLAIAYEDKDLIGSGNSITSGRPDEVKKFIAMVKEQVIPIIGAGVSTKEDIKAGLEFGAKGFLLASAFAKAPDKVAKLLELCEPFLVE